MLIDIRRLSSYNELRDVQSLEQYIWKESPIPLHQTFTAIQNGGIVLGAYINDKLVGFSYSFAGFKNNFPYLCSHILGVHPEFRNQGIGRQLKKAQQQQALSMGYTLMTWTYDPLESRNAYLNLTKLPVICRTYVENCYGDMQDEMNNGLPSDRFKVEWWLDHPTGKKENYTLHREGDIFSLKKTRNGFFHLEKTKQSIEKIKKHKPIKQLQVPIPSNFQQMKKADMELARDWRLKTREIFQHLFALGYLAVALKREKSLSISKYIFIKEEAKDKPRLF